VNGRCWLYCRRDDVRVLWIGPVRTPGADGNLFACGPCIAELTRMVRDDLRLKDLRALRPAPVSLRIPAYVPCGHDFIGKRIDGTFCKGCRRQIYL
jgi:hypothetical protein